MSGNLYELRARRRPRSRPAFLHRRGGPVEVRGPCRPEGRDRPHQGERSCGRERRHRYGSVRRLYAMDFFFKHWDGYSRNTNNTYLYNDVDAVAAPGVADVKLKFIPWGVDQILQPPAASGSRPRAGSRTSCATTSSPRAADRAGPHLPRDRFRPGGAGNRDRADDRRDGEDAGAPRRTRCRATNGEVRRQLQLASSAGYLFGGVPAGSDVHILTDTGDCLHASNTEAIPAGAAPPVNFEVVHRPLSEHSDDSDLWTVGDLGAGKSLTSQAYGRVLHASTMTSRGGHKVLYTCAPNNTERARSSPSNPCVPPMARSLATPATSTCSAPAPG